MAYYFIHCGLVMVHGDIDLGQHWCLTIPSHYLNQYWLLISEVVWHSPCEQSHLLCLPDLWNLSGTVSLQHLQNYIHQHQSITVFWLVFSTFLWKTRQHSTQSVRNMPPPSPRHLLPHVLQIMPRNAKYDQFQPKGHHNEENPQSMTKTPGNPKFYLFH